MTFYKIKKRNMLLLLGAALFLGLLFFKFLFSEEYSKEIRQSREVFFSKEAGFYEEGFWLEMTAQSGDIYYTLDGSVPTRDSLKYEEPIFIDDASKQKNEHSMRTDVSVRFETDIIKADGTDTTPDYMVPDFNVDKATILRAVTCDAFGNYGEVKTATFFVNYAEKDGYDGLHVISIVAEPDDLFGYETGIYVTGEKYDEYKKEIRDKGIPDWREEFWIFWPANYRERGAKWERKAECQFFNENGQLVLSKTCGIRIHGGGSRAYNPKSLNIYSRKEYDGSEVINADLFGTGYYPSAVTLFQGGDDERTKAEDCMVSNRVKPLDVASMHYVPYALFLNGEYWGFYWLNEKYNAEYLAYYYGVDEKNVILVKNGQLEEGSEDDLLHYQRMYEFCSTADMTKEENYEEACRMIDIDNYLDYYAVMIYIGRYLDWPDNNFALWRVGKTDDSPYGDGKWRWIIFDLNSAGFEAEHETISHAISTDLMFGNMMNNQEVRDKLFQKLKEYGATLFDETEMVQQLEEYETQFADAMRKNDKRFWGEDTLETFYQEMNNLKFFFKNRKENIDLQITQQLLCY